MGIFFTNHNLPSIHSDSAHRNRSKAIAFRYAEKKNNTPTSLMISVYLVYHVHFLGIPKSALYLLFDLPTSKSIFDVITSGDLYKQEALKCTGLRTCLPFDRQVLNKIFQPCNKTPQSQYIKVALFSEFLCKAHRTDQRSEHMLCVV